MLLLALLPMVVWAQPKSFWGQHVNIKQASGDSIQHDLARTGDFMPVVKDGKVVWSFLAGKDGYTIDNVTSIDFPRAEIIGDSAFNNCSSLSSITIPSSVTSVESNAFSGCTGLKSVVYL